VSKLLIQRFPVVAITVGATLVAVALAGCGTRAAEPAFSVNSEPVSVALYQSMVSTEQHKFERTGAPVNWQSVSGQRRRANIESSVIRELVRDAVVEQLATERGIALTPVDLQQGLSAAEQAFGGPVAFEQNLEQAGLSRSEFSSILRYRILETRLTQGGAASKGAIDKAVGRAHVVATIGPCAGNGSYPACLTPE
jgi:SurA N-terminal domain